MIIFEFVRPKQIYRALSIALFVMVSSLFTNLNAQTTDSTAFVAAVVYPNPFTSKIHIKHNKIVEFIEEVSIYDAIGNLIYSFDISNDVESILEWNGTTFGGSSVNSGTYICYIRTRTKTESFLIQKI